MESAYSIEVVLGLAILGIVGSATNLSTLIKVASGFDKRRVCYFLAYIDTLASTIGYIVFTFSTVIGNLVTRDGLSCSLMVMSLYLPHVYGLITTAQVSIIRQRGQNNMLLALNTGFKHNNITGTTRSTVQGATKSSMIRKDRL